MSAGTCNLGLESLSGYKDLQTKAKTLLRGLYSDETFNAVIQKYYDENHSLPNSKWIQFHLDSFKETAQASSVSEDEEGRKNLHPSTETKKVSAREKWSNSGEEGFEIGSKATSELGKKFDPLKAILPPGTVISWKPKGSKKFEQIDVSGYSIAAALAKLKGYDQHGLKVPQSIKDINGYGDKILSHSPIFATTRQKERLFSFYKNLWKRWANANPEIIEELRNAVGEGIITDTSATGIHYNINPAKAMAEILFGAEEELPSERRQNIYKKQRENAQRAVDEIMQAVKRSDDRVQIVTLPKPTSYDEKNQELIAYIKEHGKFGFAYKYKYASRAPKAEGFTNPFEGQPNAIEKFIQWLIPDDFSSLPAELRKESIQRNKLRIALNRGQFKDFTFLTNDTSKEGIRYVDVLRYMVDNFEMLKSRYNPISERAQEYALAKHKVSISDPIDHKTTLTLSEDNKNNSSSHRYVEIEEKVNPETQVGIGEYIITTHEDSGYEFTDTQRERLLKSAIIAIPSGAKYSIDGSEMQVRKEKAPQMVVTEGRYVSRDQAAKDNSRVYVFSDNFVDAANGYVPTTKTQDAVRGLPNAIGIPIRRDRNSFTQSYLTDSDYDFNLFKAAVDKAISQLEAIIDRNNELYEKAQLEPDIQKKQQLLDQIKTIVLPAAKIGTGGDMLNKKAPRLYEYLQEQLTALEEKGNKAYQEELSLGIQEANVRKLEETPVTSEQAMDKEIIESPFVKVQQEFGRHLNDAIDTIAGEFISLVNDLREDLLDEVDEQIAATDKNTSTAELQNLKNKRTALADSLKGAQMALSEYGNDFDEIIKVLKERLLDYVNDDSLDPQARSLYQKACDEKILKVLLRYSLPIVEEREGLRIIMSNRKVAVEKASNKVEDNSNADDPEGKKATGNDGWSFSVRENDPYKSLSAGVRRLISTIEMRDPEDLNYVLYNAFGATKYWDSAYIYTSVMSWMAKNLRNNPDNFVRVITDYDALPKTVKDKLLKDEITKETFKTRFPKGYPVFDGLEQMKNKYIWANDLIERLTDDYRVSENPSAEELANIGNIVSQFYTNFNQQFINYYILVDGKLVAENHPTGASSLKEATINNYEGRITLNYHNDDPSKNPDEPAPMV